ncbi:substrate-binding periplasmic protein [uncultured Pseudodesulfovibrio sp.]|uniref:substrate-binding periplasmic protein n=1 Tax=uncultured Pseudodesulfovibrio sp. TaxID=2035858 RepID=UPI0037496AFB
MRVVSFWLLLLLLPLILRAGPVWAETISFGYDEYPPLSYTVDGEARGRTISLIREASKRLGIEPVFVSQPFIRLLVSVKEGSVDSMVDLYETPERSKFLFFAARSATSEDVSVYVRSRSGVRISGLEDLARHKIGAVRGYYYGKLVDRKMMSRFRMVKDCKVLYSMLLEGRFDAVVGNSLAAEHYVGDEIARGEVVSVLKLARLEYHVAFSHTLGSRGRRLADLYAEEIWRILMERGELNPAP